MIPNIALTREQKARLIERPTVCVFCGEPVRSEDHRNADVMLHKVSSGARLCHKSCVGYMGAPGQLFCTEGKLSG